MSKAGASGYILSWFPRPYWLDAGSYLDTLAVKPDSIDFIVFKVYYSEDNNDPKSEFIVDNLELAYGKGNPWWDGSIDSTTMIDRFGDGEQGTGIEELSESPKTFQLDQNYPNPFNPVTTISFSLLHSEYSSLKIFDLMGREIATLVSKNLTAGNYSFEWDASNQPSGVYFYRLQSGQYSATRKLLFLK